MYGEEERRSRRLKEKDKRVGGREIRRGDVRKEGTESLNEQREGIKHTGGGKAGAAG